MIIPESVTNVVTKGPFDNDYFYHAYDAMKRLEKIDDKSIEFYNDDYALLINTLERFYKGFLQSKCDNDNLNLPIGFLTMDHDLCKLVREIERYTPLFVVKSIEDERNKIHFLNSLRKSYTDARYTQNYLYDDFHKLFEFVKKQQKVLEFHLQPPKEIIKNNEMEIDL